MAIHKDLLEERPLQQDLLHPTGKHRPYQKKRGGAQSMILSRSVRIITQAKSYACLFRFQFHENQWGLDSMGPPRKVRIRGRIGWHCSLRVFF